MLWAGFFLVNGNVLYPRRNLRNHRFLTAYSNVPAYPDFPVHQQAAPAVFPSAQVFPAELPSVSVSPVASGLQTEFLSVRELRQEGYNVPCSARSEDPTQQNIR